MVRGGWRDGFRGLGKRKVFTTEDSADTEKMRYRNSRGVVDMAGAGVTKGGSRRGHRGHRDSELGHGVACRGWQPGFAWHFPTAPAPDGYGAR